MIRNVIENALEELAGLWGKWPDFPIISEFHNIPRSLFRIHKRMSPDSSHKHCPRGRDRNKEGMSRIWLNHEKNLVLRPNNVQTTSTQPPIFDKPL